MSPVRKEEKNMGASYLTVICQDCVGSLGPKWIFHEHNGYASQGGTPVNKEQVGRAEEVIKGHNRNHDMRFIEGKLE